MYQYKNHSHCVARLGARKMFNTKDVGNGNETDAIRALSGRQLYLYIYIHAYIQPLNEMLRFFPLFCT